MSRIEIRKRISLDFLGEDYKEAYLEFKSLPIREYKENIAQSKALDGKDAGAAVDYIGTFLEARFVSGKFPIAGKMEELSADDVRDFDAEVIYRCFQALTGQLDPKA